MTQLQPPSLSSLFVFNPQLGNEETESRKLLYFYPPSTPMNAQKDTVGLLEGLLAFTSELSPSSPLSVVRSDELLYGCIECEPSFFIAMAIQHPALVSRVKGGGAGGEKRVDWQPDDVDDDAIPTLLRHTYRNFRLLNGSFAANAAAHPMDVLRARLDLFFRFFLPTMGVASLHTAPLLSGFHFLPVDKATFLTIQFLINHTMATFLTVRHIAVLADAKLIYTTLPGDDMECLYSLLQQHHIPLLSYLAINEELSTRIHEAAATGAGGAEGGGGAAKPGSRTTDRGEGGDGDVFAIPQSLYEEMGVKGYRGAGSTESKAADFLASPPVKAKVKVGALPRAKRADADGKGGGVVSPKGEGGVPVGFLTGPYRGPLPASLLPYSSGQWAALSSPMWTQPLPLTLEDRACVNSPQVFLTHTAQGEGEGEGGDGEERKESSGGVGNHRLVVYRRQSITLMFIVASLPSSLSCPSSPSSPSPPSSSNHPPLSFYDTLESQIHSTLKKLAAALATSTSSSSTSSSASPSTSSSPAPPLPVPSSSSSSSPSSSLSHSSSSVESDFRFLYYNRMNLALKCTWEGKGGVIAGEVLRVLREMREGMRKRRGGGESVVKVKGHGWVVGRVALQSQRECYLLLDERTLTLADVHREMDTLTRSYFANVALA